MLPLSLFHKLQLTYARINHCCTTLVHMVVVPTLQCSALCKNAACNEIQRGRLRLLSFLILLHMWESFSLLLERFILLLSANLFLPTDRHWRRRRPRPSCSIFRHCCSLSLFPPSECLLKLLSDTQLFSSFSYNDFLPLPEPHRGVRVASRQS